MTDLISFPFRVDPGSGAVVTTDDTGVDYMGEELGQLIQTQPGERELVPTYGLNDPTYTRFDEAMLTAQTHLFGPPIRIDSITARFLDDTTQDVVVTFHVDPDLAAADAPAGYQITDTTSDQEPF